MGSFSSMGGGGGGRILLGPKPIFAGIDRGVQPGSVGLFLWGAGDEVGDCDNCGEEEGSRLATTPGEGRYERWALESNIILSSVF